MLVYNDLSICHSFFFGRAESDSCSCYMHLLRTQGLFLWDAGGSTERVCMLHNYYYIRSI